MQLQAKMIDWMRISKLTGIFAAVAATLVAGVAFASGEVDTVGDLATHVTGSMKPIGSLMIAVAYLAGIGFMVAGIFKFKQYKDNPTQIQLSMPLALVAIGAALLFAPMLFGPLGKTIFGKDDLKGGGFTGDGTQYIPGGEGTTP